MSATIIFHNSTTAACAVGYRFIMHSVGSYNLGNSRNVPEPDALLDESGPAISMIGVNCVGDEESLFDCSFRQEVDGDCYQYNNNVAVLCVPTDPASPLLPSKHNLT